MNARTRPSKWFFLVYEWGNLRSGNMQWLGPSEARDREWSSLHDKDLDTCSDLAHQRLGTESDPIVEARKLWLSCCWDSWQFRNTFLLRYNIPFSQLELPEHWPHKQKWRFFYPFVSRTVPLGPDFRKVKVFVVIY